MRQQNSKAINWAGFASALIAKPERLPSGGGWMTCKELMKKYKIARSRVYKTLRVMKHESFKGQINKDGQLVRRVWYRPL